MKCEDKILLAKKIESDFDNFCGKHTISCSKCSYANSELDCKIEFTLSYLNKRKMLKENKSES